MTMHKLKVVVAHNAYQLKGGEDAVMEAELALLRSQGHDVALFSRHNDDIGSMSAPSLALQTIWSTAAAQEFEALLRRFKPDVVHVHNTFPLISPAIYWVADRLGVPVVQTLHNFRLLCPQAIFLRNGKVCEDCLGKLPWRGALRGCYRESRMQTTVLAGMVTIHQAMGTWHHKVTRYIALNDFCRSKFLAAGFPEDRFRLKPNFVDFDAPPLAQRNGFLFVGRLSSEKGIDVLVRATQLMGNAQVSVAGTGPQSNLLQGVQGLTALGSLSVQQVQQAMANATALVLPSICYESFPRTLVEAFGCGLPVIASRLGALPNLVVDGYTGLLFEAGNAADLAEKMHWAETHPQAMADMGRNARAEYEAKYTAESNYTQLIAIYADAIATKNAT